jgi:hypothetical protein
VASYSEGLEHNRIAFAIRVQTRMCGRSHQLRRNQNLARIIDLDNHHELRTIDDRSIQSPCAHTTLPRARMMPCLEQLDKIGRTGNQWLALNRTRLVRSLTRSITVS